MKRELKFRVWKYHHILEKHIMCDITNESILYLMDNETFPDRVIMQYTGLMDLLGRPIYEGDILRWTSWKKDTAPYNNVVEYFAGGQSCGFRIRNKSFMKPLTANGIYNAKAEIIGNIYANPDLL